MQQPQAGSNAFYYKRIHNLYRIAMTVIAWQFFISASAAANPIAGLNEVGEARLRVFFFTIYDSTLFTPTGEYNGVQPNLALQIEYRRRITADRLLEQTRKEWQKQGLYQEDFETWIQQLDQFWPDVDKGDEITLKVDDDLASEFYYNGEKIGEMGASAFTERFLAIWLSEQSSYPDLRNQLVGAD